MNVCVYKCVFGVCVCVCEYLRECLCVWCVYGIYVVV